MIENLLGALGQLDWPVLLYLIGAGFIAALMHSTSGVGGGFLLALMIAPVVGIKATIPVVAIAQSISHIGRVWAFRKTIDRSVFIAVSITAVPASMASAAIYSHLPERGVAGLLGAVLLASVPARRILAKRNYRTTRTGFTMIGIPFGLLVGATVGSGFLLIPFFLGAGIVGQWFVGTLAAIALSLNLARIVVFGVFDIFTPELVVAAVLIGLCTLPATYLGRCILRRIPAHAHEIFLEMLVMLGGVLFLWHAIAG